MTRLRDVYKEEAKDAMDNRHYGPLMGLTVIVFWTAVIWLVASSL